MISGRKELSLIVDADESVNLLFYLKSRKSFVNRKYRISLSGLYGRGLWLNSLLLDSIPLHLTARETVQKMPHTHGGETSSSREFSHTP